MFILSGLFNMNMSNAQPMPWDGQKGKALSNKASHIDWPAFTENLP